MAVAPSPTGVAVLVVVWHEVAYPGFGHGTPVMVALGSVGAQMP